MKRTNTRRLQILTGTHHAGFAEAVAKKLGIEVSPANIERFANSELKCRLGESMRGSDVFIFQAHDMPVSEAIIEQAILIDAAKRASARHITAVCPFLGYARQDRKSSGREPITAKLVVDILAVAGANRIVSVDLHTGQIQGFFDGPFDHLIAMPVLVEYIAAKKLKDLVIVSPDAGGVKLADRYANHLKADLAIVHKKRPRSNHAEALHVIGDVNGKNCVIVDDMIDTAGTICAAADQLKARGAKSIIVAATHGLFSGPAQERIAASAIDTICITDTLPPRKVKIPNVEVVSVVGLVANAIEAIFLESSVSELFNGENQS